MASPVTINHYALFDDVVAVARTAHAATAGWRAICVRAQRTVGKNVVQPLSELDLGEEIPSLASRVREIVQNAPNEIDTLVFGLFDGIEDDEGAGLAGYHLMGANGFDPSVRWLRAPSWLPDDRFLHSPSLDAIVRAGMLLRGGEVKAAVAHPLRFGAAALLSRFAAQGLPHRIVVTFDDGDFAEIRSVG